VAAAVDVMNGSGNSAAAIVRPYDGVIVLDLTQHYGRYAGKLFADLGATVIRIDDCRTASGKTDARTAFLDSGKKSVLLDLSAAATRPTLDALLRQAAVVLIERGGPIWDDPAAVHRQNPAAIVTAISPYGMTGPLADAPASDLVLQAAGGIAWMSGRIEREPLVLPFEQATMVASIYAATVTAIALHHAEATGTGHLIDVSAQECIAHSLQNAVQVFDLEGRISIRGGEGTRDASEDIFPCRDGFVFLASPLSLGTSWKQLVAWMRELGDEAGEHFSAERWLDREWRLTREAREDFRAAFTRFSSKFDKATLAREAIARRIVMAPVARISDVLADPQLIDRGFFTKVETTDGRAIAFPGAPYKLSVPVWKTARAPEPGEHRRLVDEVTA
jgi:benzylsuccinate CoA-transferase BbsE subunit